MSCGTGVTLHIDYYPEYQSRREYLQVVVCVVYRDRGVADVLESEHPWSRDDGVCDLCVIITFLYLPR